MRRKSVSDRWSTTLICGAKTEKDTNENDITKGFKVAFLTNFIRMVHKRGRGGGVTGVCGRHKYRSDEMSRQNLVRKPEV
jgi:hypothetical protein